MFGYQCAFTWLPTWLGGKESACQERNAGLIPGSGRSPGERNGSPLQYSCLENSMDTGIWWATVHCYCTQFCVTLCKPTHCPMPGFPVLHESPGVCYSPWGHKESDMTMTK